ncbi:succinoglycan biosynthesis transport protein ExoP [Flavobacterium sp. PL11]|uniref:exopolysaccharide transport family protein n=1 Tax=Flavobacterium sp. PL11 TaxID=3071717 RepID=UPI002E009E58|nr:succinoglycan biosynthesis transport protein ExoP [Flavobacterium sp. PL11]
MKIIDFIRLLLKHLTLLIVVPLLLAVLVLLLTSKPSLKYTSQTILYTGLASGSSIEMEKTFNYFATNTDFDNLINIVNSRETQEEVAVRLLATHLLLPAADPKYISKKHYDEIKSKVPTALYTYIKKTPISKVDNNVMPLSNAIPAAINPYQYEKTVERLLQIMRSSNDNYIYELLNYEGDDHYSLKALSTIQAVRINSSDLIKLTYTVNDPGICQQTLLIFNEICIKNYKTIKENRSDDVVKYFEEQLNKASTDLKLAEEKLLQFNKSYNIINYYEQSKAVAVVKEEMGVEYNDKKAQLAGTEASVKRLEEKLRIQEYIQKENNIVLEKKKLLGDINYKIAVSEANLQSNKNEELLTKLNSLRKQKETLAEDIKKSVDDIYSYQNSTDGVPLSKVLPDWMTNVVEAENLKAKINVMDQQSRRFEDQYAMYAPAGATIKRIEREISVSEQGYLELLHGLNQAKLKVQDNQMSSNLKAVDPPYYPLSANPTKRGLLIVIAAFLGGIMTIAIILIMEYFDDTLKNVERATKKLGLSPLGIIPKIVLNPGDYNLNYIQKRLLEIIAQKIGLFLNYNPAEQLVKTIVIFSTQHSEGKSVVAGNLAKTLKQEGKKVLLLQEHTVQQEQIKQRKFPMIHKILGYSDPRVDLKNSFLAPISTYLDPQDYSTYTLNQSFYESTNYKDLVATTTLSLNHKPDFVIIELPALLYNNSPSHLLATADLGILVCRANRVWTEADQAAIEAISTLSRDKIKFILNGVDINETESILGDLPKKRTAFRKKIKSMFEFQFFSKNQI